MKTFLLNTGFCLLMIFSNPSALQSQSSQASPSAILDSIISLTQRNSLYTDKVDWEELSEEMRAMLLDNDSLEAIIPPVELMFKELRDFHGALFINQQRYNSYYKTDYHYPTSQKIFGRIHEIGSEVKAEMLQNQLAYIKIPHYYLFGQDQINSSTKIIKEKICELKAQNPQGWIIDLRMNLGGNMYPMFAGLGELFPNMKLSGDSRDGEHYHSEWYNEGGNFHMWNSPMTAVDLLCNEAEKAENERVKIAVLVGRYTSSSGEAVASALKGQDNFRLFGEITSGWSSTTGYFPITENVFITPTVAWFMSVDKTLHKDGIHPDTLIVEEVNPDALTEGKVIEAAMAWVLE